MTVNKNTYLQIICATLSYRIYRFQECDLIPDVNTSRLQSGKLQTKNICRNAAEEDHINRYGRCCSPRRLLVRCSSSSPFAESHEPGPRNSTAKSVNSTSQIVPLLFVSTCAARCCEFANHEEVRAHVEIFNFFYWISDVRSSEWVCSF